MAQLPIVEYETNDGKVRAGGLAALWEYKGNVEIT